MKFGSDIWLWLRFLVAIIKILKELFGDEEDKEDIAKNGKTIEAVNGKNS